MHRHVLYFTVIIFILVFAIHLNLHNLNFFFLSILSSLLNERKVWKPNAPMTDRLMAKAIEAHAS